MRTLFRGSWTDPKARRATLKLLGEIDDRLNELGYIWGDEDQYIVEEADHYKEEFIRLKTSLQEHWREKDEENTAGGRP